MIGIILTILIGLGIAYISNKSTPDITITVGNYKYFNIPLYFMTLGTYMLGILLAWAIEIPQTILTALQTMGLKKKINSGNNTITELENKIKKLETENIRLRGLNNQSVIADKQADGSYKPNFIQNLLHKINTR